MSTTINKGSPSGYVFDQLRIKTHTASYVAVADDFKGNVAAVMDATGANTLTVNTGMAATRALLVINEGAGLCTVTAGTGVTIKSSGGATRLTERYSMATLVPDPSAADTYWLTGALA